MSELKSHALSQVFAYGDRMVRTAGTAEAPLFRLGDVCSCLGIGNVTMATERLEEDEFSSTEVVDSAGKRQEALFVTEAGLYSLVLGSRKLEAKTFKRWVTHEVLPAIRRTGSYSMATATPSLNAEQLTAAIVSGVVTAMAMQIDTLARRNDFIGPARAREVKQVLLAHAKAITKSGTAGSVRSQRRRDENHLRAQFGFDGPGSSWEFFSAAKWPELRQELERMRAETDRLAVSAQDALPFSKPNSPDSPPPLLS
jgi:prophage antirepressor-like protein